VRTYVLVTGIIFGLIVLVHVWRAAAEGHLHTEVVALTVLAAALCGWAARLLLGRPRTS
jgi:hypothetical protein